MTVRKRFGMSRALRFGLATGLAAAAAVLALALVGLGGGTHNHRATIATPPQPHGAALVPDPEAAQAYPESSSTPPHAPAAAPTAAPPAALATSVAPGAPSDAEVRRELAQMQAVLRAERAATTTSQHGALIDQFGAAKVPLGAPTAVARVMAAGNEIATFPYRFGGGHASFIDNAYDCSGSLSYALAAAGLIVQPITSGEFAQWGLPGPGRWITVYANAGHTFMYVAGLRYDTSFRAGPRGSRWQAAVRSSAGFVARHWPGL